MVLRLHLGDAVDVSVQNVAQPVTPIGPGQAEGFCETGAVEAGIERALCQGGIAAGRDVGDGAVDVGQPEDLAREIRPGRVGCGGKMVEAGFGRIVNMASLAGKEGTPNARAMTTESVL